MAVSFAAAGACPAGGTTYTGGAGIATLNSALVAQTENPQNVQAIPYPSNLTIPNSATGTVATICVTINGLNATGEVNNAGYGDSTQGLAIALVAPNGTRLGIMGSTGGGNQSLSGATLYISDSASQYMPDGNSGNTSTAPLEWPNSSGPFTYKPSSYANNYQDTTFPTLGTLTSAQLPYDLCRIHIAAAVVARTTRGTRASP